MRNMHLLGFCLSKVGTFVDHPLIDRNTPIVCLPDLFTCPRAGGSRNRSNRVRINTGSTLRLDSNSLGCRTFSKSKTCGFPPACNFTVHRRVAHAIEAIEFASTPDRPYGS